MLPDIAWTLPVTTDSPARVESARCSSHPQTSSPSNHLGYSVNIAHSLPGWCKLSWLDIWYVVIYTLCELQTEVVVLSVGYWSTPKPILRNSSSITSVRSHITTPASSEFPSANTRHPQHRCMCAAHSAHGLDTPAAQHSVAHAHHNHSKH